MQKKALITGITGQDGSYLAQFLLEKEYEVHGMIRRSSTSNTQRIDHLIQAQNIKLHYGDLTDASSITSIIAKVQPDEIYNLAAQSHVAVSFENPVYTAQVCALGVTHILEAVRILGLEKRTKIYQASSSELFGKVQEIPQKESTPFYPRSPYAVAKLYAYWIIVNYRESYQLFACNGILFNHESPVRGGTFVTKKITQAIARIALGCQQQLKLGNLEARRDWGFAKDYVEAMWLMLQQPAADDFVIATGTSHSVRDFVEAACRAVEIPLQWRGSGCAETGIDTRTNQVIVTIDPTLFRPAEVDILLGDPSKAARILEWKPKTNFTELVYHMMQEELSYLTEEGDTHECCHGRSCHRRQWVPTDRISNTQKST